MFPDPSVGHQLIYAGKIAGAVAAILGVLYGAGRSLLWIVRKILNINDNVHLMVTNHLPHMQASLNAQDEALSTIKSDVRDMDTKVAGVSQRLEDTRKSVHTLGESFVHHLETSAQQLVDARAESARNELDITAIKAAQKVIEDASTTAKNLIDTTQKRES